mmetsp:Transcript_12017/g.51742  ORF Transcript_12017/g.51742 Transcript_12017/m.51742 type:complete len:238 (-) Transcript_12017:423-1136(-)
MRFVPERQRPPGSGPQTPEPPKATHQRPQPGGEDCNPQAPSHVVRIPSLPGQIILRVLLVVAEYDPHLHAHHQRQRPEPQRRGEECQLARNLLARLRNCRIAIRRLLRLRPLLAVCAARRRVESVRFDAPVGRLRGFDAPLGRLRARRVPRLPRRDCPRVGLCQQRQVRIKHLLRAQVGYDHRDEERSLPGVILRLRYEQRDDGREREHEGSQRQAVPTHRPEIAQRAEEHEEESAT